MGKNADRDDLLGRSGFFGHELTSPASPAPAFRTMFAKAALAGGGGNDVLTGQSANDTISGGGGDDLLFGGSGNDTLNGDAGNDQLAGGSGDDTLTGGAGNDQTIGGAGNDVLTGGDGDDQMIGGAGNDRMIWNAGDDNDLMEGGTEIDTAEVNGGAAGETFSITANGTRVRFDQLSAPASFLDIGTTERLVIKMNGGDDKISATGNLAALIQITVDGGDGNDTILGSNGVDTLIGGNGDDFIDGQQGNDVAFMGAGNDVFQWDPGDGSDIVEGQAGIDILRFNGSAGAEIMAVSANGGRALFTRNLGNIVMDVDDVESIQVNALNGTDTITVNDLQGTDVKHVLINLAAPSGITGDGAADSLIVQATNNDDTIVLTSTGAQTIINGLAAKVTFVHADAGDVLQVNGLGGDDRIDASAHAAGPLTMRLSGGAGDDFITGSAGGDVIIGGAGDDLLLGKAGNDTFVYASALDGHDIIADFDGDATGGQDTVDLDALFDALGVAAADRAGRITLTDNGNSVTVNIDTDGAGGADLVALTLNTPDAIAVGDDILVGT